MQIVNTNHYATAIKPNGDTIHLPYTKGLTELYCRDKNIISLDTSNNPNLFSLNCSLNKLTKLDVSNNSKLLELICSQNQIKVLDISKNHNLSTLDCRDNKISPLPKWVVKERILNMIHNNNEQRLFAIEKVCLRSSGYRGHITNLFPKWTKENAIAKFGAQNKVWWWENDERDLSLEFAKWAMEIE